MDINQKCGINYENYRLLQEGMPQEKRIQLLNNFKRYLNHHKNYSLGYQVNQRSLDEDGFKQFLDFHINNAGDPFVAGNYNINSKPIEQAVLDYYGKLWNAVTPYNQENPESFWGYTLSMGSTEGNVYAIWSARDYLTGRPLLMDDKMDHYRHEVFINDDKRPIPVAFYSQDTHYSIVKAMKVLNFNTFYMMGHKYPCPLKYPEDYPEGFSFQYLGKNQWPLEVPSNQDGSIHIPSLVKLVDFFAKKGHPIFVNFNYGTTFKGAYDDVEKAVKALVPILEKYKMYGDEIPCKHVEKNRGSKRQRFWFHVDGALGAAYMPFVEKAIKDGKLAIPEGYEFPVFDFRIPEINSIVTSIHKWIGSPYPCGLFMTKRKFQLLPPDNPMYIGSPDTTFAGSRNGLTPIILWDFLASKSENDLNKMAVKTEMTARYMETKLKEVESILQKDLWVERSPLALTVRFRKPNDELVYKYSLSCESLYVNGIERSYVHVYAMESTSKELIDCLIEDLRKPEAFSGLEDVLRKEEVVISKEELMKAN